MAREIQITPRRIQYAQEKEADLYKSLIIVASEKQKEITHLIEVTLQEMREGLIEIASVYQYHGMSSVYNRTALTQSHNEDFTLDVFYIYSLIYSLVYTGCSRTPHGF
jgi:hypothetical protein